MHRAFKSLGITRHISQNFRLFATLRKEMPQKVTLPPNNEGFGVRVIPTDEIPSLKGAPWPSEFGRSVEGGNEDSYVTVESLGTSEPGPFFARVDGPTYIKAKDDGTFKMMIKKGDNTFEIEFLPGNGVIVQPFTQHTRPFANPSGFVQIKRATNGIISESETSYSLPKAAPKLSSVFTTEKLHLEEASPDAAYDIVQHSSIAERTFTSTSGKHLALVTPADWPLLSSYNIETVVPALEQEFTMEWISDNNTKEIQFEGLSGSLAGGKGRPGVIYNEKDKSLSVDLLLCRPDGSFFVSTEEELIMLIAQPTNNGEPDRSTLKAISFKNGVKLPKGWWHSVPFPPLTTKKITIHEKIAATNANIIINVKEESGAPIIIQF